MTEDRLLERYRADRPMLDALGSVVIDLIKEHPQVRQYSTGLFIMPPQSRTKSEESLLQKAFYRKKQYADPYEDITDKVGVRFVVLTVDQVRFLKGIVERLEKYEKSLDRDFEEERRKNPTIFSYQSVHYVIRPIQEVVAKELIIKAGLPCEVQLRTVLQHAYSELTHDTIYKPKAYAEPEIHRLAARSMALIETTDEIFCEAMSRFDQLDRSMDSMLDKVLFKYSKGLPFKTEPKLNALILDSLKSLLKNVNEKEIDTFMERNGFLFEKVRERAKTKLLFRQPIILLLYFLVYNVPAQMNENWPLVKEELDPIFADLGMSRIT